MMQLSFLSRTTSISYSFQPSTLSSISTSLVGEASMPRSTMVMKLVLVVGDAATRSTHGERRPDDRGQADVVERLERLRQRFDLVCDARRLEPDLGHGVAEQLAVFRLVDRLGRAPIILTLNLSSTPIFLSESAVFSAVCPPIVGSSASGRSFSMILATISGVIGSI